VNDLSFNYVFVVENDFDGLFGVEHSTLRRPKTLRFVFIAAAGSEHHNFLEASEG